MYEEPEYTEEDGAGLNGDSVLEYEEEDEFQKIRRELPTSVHTDQMVLVLLVTEIFDDALFNTQ